MELCPQIFITYTLVTWLYYMNVSKLNKLDLSNL